MNFFLFDRLAGLIFLVVMLSLLNSCNNTIEPQKNEVIKTEYPKLADEIIERDFDELRKFTDHENVHGRMLVWKAIGKSEAADLREFVDYAVQQDDSLVWHSLALQPLSGDLVDSISHKFSEGEIRSESVCNLFFVWGDSNTLNSLLQKPDMLMKSEVCSKAVGGILSRIQVSDVTRRQVFDLAFNSGDEIIWRNLLYGFYRSPANRPNPESVLNENIATYLESQGHLFSIEMDRYITRISGKVGFMNVLERRSDRELNEAVQLSVELARNIILLDRDELNDLYVKRLLRHRVDNVVAQSLQSLQEFEEVPNALLDMIEFEIASITRDPEIFFEALNLLAKNDREVEGYHQKIEFMKSKNPYLKAQILSLYNKIESNEEYLDRLENNIQKGGVDGLRSIQALMGFYAQNYEENPEWIDRIKQVAQAALEDGDPSVMAALTSFLRIPVIFPEEDYDWMYDRYRNFIESEQWENAKVVEEVLANRFSDRFEPLNIPEKPFRIPNWERLYEMGTKPYWVLKTEKGTIEIQLDPLASPFTVSSIDSLTRAGEYNDVPFHRVVRSFVIQGGDIERQDGHGGPDYKIPTEPSFKSFERGTVGMASDGTDTEGSQYFVMLNWSPHLDPNYTIFGKVTKGMDVADRIQVGDRVIKAEIYSR
jgi:cyclophilin family peptidyl-prolyl cis-trans isomerase